MLSTLDWGIDDDIRRASTLPAGAYADPRVYDLARERVFARSWQIAGDTDMVRVPGQVHPVTLLEGMLDEPLVLTRDAQDRLHCLSNVCTHRGALLCEHPGVEPAMRCRYHGRRFALDGRFLSMPEFEGAEGFPSEADHLTRVSFGSWGKLVFVSLDPAFPLAELIAEMDARVSFLPLSEASFDPTRSRDYLVRANWALYCDNYLEGFHIPYVHAALAGALDYGEYRTELFPYANVQVGVASGGEEVFDLPAGHPDHGLQVAAWYFWLFPNTMINVYPWGISVNVVRPLAPDRTKISFLSYVWDPSRLDRGAGSGLDRVEREDEAVVESVQRGIRSRLYHRGRYSPTRETGVHHFHRLLTRFLHGAS
ncbi:MAG TPA: aromatic ring-hydroxylating dioxygenase subunit alpha [Thermoanaerobaculia bacterium]|nr:aromatic ring-hydroxylating dioxygenase subunit alpha [Thermoanaerobaculia bacterium]